MIQWTEQYWIQTWLVLYKALPIVLHRGGLEKSETYVYTFSLRQTSVSQCQRNNLFTTSVICPEVLLFPGTEAQGPPPPLWYWYFFTLQQLKMGVPVKTSRNNLETKLANWLIRGRLSISNPSRSTSRELNDLNTFGVVCNLVSARISPSNFPVIIFDSS